MATRSAVPHVAFAWHTALNCRPTFHKLGVLMARRLTDKPYSVFKSQVTETSANVYTEDDMQLPIAVVGATRFQAIELCKVHSDHHAGPDDEAAQENTIESGVRKRSGGSGADYNDDDLIWGRKSKVDNTTAVGSNAYDGIKHDDITDGDGNGIVIAERTIHHFIDGSGNATAKVATCRGIGHLIELTSAEVIGAVLEAD